MTKEEIAQITSDGQWWDGCAALVDCRVVGFTDRTHAGMQNQYNNEYVEIPGWLANRIIQLSGR